MSVFTECLFTSHTFTHNSFSICFLFYISANNTSILPHSDSCICFYCGCVLHGWVEGDDPSVEHVRLYGACTYVLQTRSPDFAVWVYRNFQDSHDHVNNPDHPQSSSLSVIPPISNFHVLDKEQRWREICDQGQDYLPLSDALKILPNSGEELKNLIKLHLYENESEFQNAGEMLQYKIEREKAANGENNSTKNKNKNFSKKVSPESSMKPLKLESEISAMTQEELHKYVTENEQNIACKVCLNFKANVVFEPCLHVATCTRCASSFQQCPVCRMNVNKAKKVYFV